MSDHVSKTKRSQIMRAVGSKNTKPELLVRSAAHRMGLRFRLHRRDLPGSPDIVFPKHKTAMFIHGCFWHQHEGCRKSGTPKTNAKFWNDKFCRNVERDRKNIAELKQLGWDVVVVWQCELGSPEETESVLVQKLPFMNRVTT